jgi:alpha-ketoglutarate-dependent taurine dioxygenase
MSQVVLGQSWLRVPLGESSADFHYRWLRHACDRDRHPLTKERTLCSSELPDDLQPVHAWIYEGALHVVWDGDGRESVYALSWLDEHAYARARPAPPGPPHAIADYEIDGADSLEAAMAEAVARLRQRGAAIVRRPRSTDEAEGETEALIAAAEAQGLAIVSTHFGRIEDLRTDNTTNANNDQLGYTDAAVEPHTDQPFLDRPPRYQLLHSMRVADAGGENAVVDGLAAARFLAAEDRHAYDLLRTIPVTFHRKQKRFERKVTAPILSEHEGAFQIRYSYFTLAPHQVAFDEMEAFYRAYDRFARLVRDPRHQLRFLLGEGDFLLYDNHRMLHARTSFRGPRWMRGVYFDPA